MTGRKIVKYANKENAMQAMTLFTKNIRVNVQDMNIIHMQKKSIGL